MKLYKKFIVKIPKNIKIVYQQGKNILFISGPLNEKIIRLNFKILILKDNNSIYVTNNNTKFFNNVLLKNLKSIRGTQVSSIKQGILDSSTPVNNKMKLVGVGYRGFKVDNINDLYQFKLGFSHSIYYKTPQNIKLSLPKPTLIYITGDCTKRVTQLSAQIRSYKKPEPYKGKGILYNDEKIVLKQGKKI